MSKLNHIAIIPDGNRRWARKRGEPGPLGHKKGVGVFKEIMQEAFKLEIPYLTLWGASIFNIQKRDEKEIELLFNLFKKYFRELADKEEIHENKVKVRVLGRWRDFLPNDVKRAVEEVINKTKNYDGKFNLTFLLAYSGKEEMRHAVGNIARESGGEELEITDDLIKNNLYTKKLPPVDLVIRTGGEPHWSDGFMMWDIANAQMRFTETFFPDFSKEKFREIVEECSKIERRFGK